jgi:hypothetical protein
MIIWVFAAEFADDFILEQYVLHTYCTIEVQELRPCGAGTL